MKTRILISACVMVLLGSVATAETYYVSLKGDDANKGIKEAAAFRTIKKGVSVLKAGDTLIIKSGNYGNERAVVSTSGTKKAPITIKAEETGKVILKSADGKGNGIFMKNKNHVLIEGIEFGNYGAGIGIKYASSYITVRKCIFRENNSSGILVYGDFRKPEASQGIVLTENTFLDFTDKQDYGMCLYASCNLKATNNYFYGKHHQALSFKKLMKDSVASGNTFEGFLYSAIYVGQNDDSVGEGYLRSERIVVEGNVFRPSKNFHAKRAICVANVSDCIVRNNFIDSVYGGNGEGCIAIHPISTGAKIYGNLIISESGGGQPAIFVQADCEVYNNTFANCRLALEVFTGTAPVLRNNIFYNNKTQVKFTTSPIYAESDEHKTRRFPNGKVWTWRPNPAKKPVFERNNWFPKVKGMGATDISVNPKFVGPFTKLKFVADEKSPKFVADVRRADAYRLAKKSPCIDKGVKVGLKFSGKAPDLGALEVGMKKISPASEKTKYKPQPDVAKLWASAPPIPVTPPPPAAFKKGNLVTDPGAEGKGRVNMRDCNFPLGWGCYNGAGTAEWGVTDKEAHGGKNSVYMKITGHDKRPITNNALTLGKTSGYSGAEALDVLPNTTYKYSFWLKRSKGLKADLGVFGQGWSKPVNRAGSRQRISSSAPKIKPTEKWQQYQGTFKTRSNTRKVALFIIVYAKAGDAPVGATFWVDDVYLGAVSEEKSSKPAPKAKASPPGKG